MEAIVYVPSINGSEIIRMEYNYETGLYHWNGDENYAGYTLQELMERGEEPQE